MTGFDPSDPKYNYQYNGGNCPFMASDFTHMIGVQGVAGQQETWGVKNWRGVLDYQGVQGEAKSMINSQIAGVNGTNPRGWDNWLYHWWVSILDPDSGTRIQYDPSVSRHEPGGWGAAETAWIRGYTKYGSAPGAVFTNPAGQITEIGEWGMKHGNPPIAGPFIGPPTPGDPALPDGVSWPNPFP